jgi:hypothetical protein
MNAKTMTLLCSWIVLVAPLITAHLCCKPVSRGQGKRFFFLCLIVLWVTLLIVPVQFMGALEIAGVITRVAVAEVALLQLALLAGAVTWSFSYRPLAVYSVQESAIGTRERLPSYLKISAAILGASYLLFAIDLCSSFPQGSDALSYHIPLALRWLQEGSLRIPVDKAWEFSLPGNSEIIQMFALATGKQFLIPLGSWNSSIVLAIAAYAFAVRFSSGSKAPAFAAILVLFSIPIIEFQTFSAYVDLFGTAFLFAAVILFGHRYHSGIAALREVKTTQARSLSLTAVAFSALACGLSLGTKLTFIPYCALFFATAIYILWRERRIHNKPLAVLVSVVVIGMLLPSAFWYVRGLQATGNPFYPTAISLGRHVIFPGYESVTSHPEKLLIEILPGGTANHGDKKFVRHQSEWWIYPWTEWLRNAGDFPIVYGEASGLGGAFATFAVVGVGFAAYRCFGISGSNQASGVTQMVVLLWFVLLLVWVFAMHRVLRFGLPVWAFACLLSAPAIALLMQSYPRASAILFVCSISTTCAISSLVPFHDLAGHLLSGRWSRSAIYSYPAFIDELPAGTCILNDTPLPEKDFALAGKSLTNKVVTAFEAPEELTPGFISSRNIDYVVQIRSSKDMEDSSPAAVPESVSGTEVFHSTQAGKVWKIWRVKK